MAVEKRPQQRGAPVADQFHRVLVKRGERALEDIGWSPEDDLLSKGYVIDEAMTKGSMVYYKAPVATLKALQTKAAEQSLARLNQSKHVEGVGKGVVKMERGEVLPSDVRGPLDIENDMDDDPSLNL